MGDSYTTITGEDTENDWKNCVNRDTCRHIGVHPTNDTCPECRSNLERYTGPVHQCDDCEMDYIVPEEAAECC